MKALARQALASFVLIAGILTPFLQLHAQDCEIDLSGAITQLTDAQAEADGGNTRDALLAIAGVQAELDSIQQACARALALVELAATYNAPDDQLSFQYPEGWFEGEFHEGRDWEAITAGGNTLNLPLPRGGSITVTNVETPLNYSPYIALEGLQSVTVLVGTPLHLFSELGLYSEELAGDFLAGDFGFDALVAALELRINQSPMTPDLLLTQIDAAYPTVAIEAHGDITSITLVLVALDEAQNWYALLVSPVLTADNVDMLPLLQSMAATVSAPA